MLAARNEEALRPLCDEIDAGRERRAVGADVPHEEDVARIAETAIGREDLHEGYGLSDDEINDAVRWWAEVTEYEAAA